MATFVSQKQVSYESVKQLLYEKKFDTAIRDTFSYSFHQRSSTKEWNMHDKAIMIHDPSIFEKEYPFYEDTVFMAYIFDKLIFQAHAVKPHTLPRNHHQSISRAQVDVLRIQHNYLNDQNYLPNKRNLTTSFDEYLTEISSNKFTVAALEIATWLSGIIDDITHLQNRQYKQDEKEYITSLSKHNYHKRPDLGMFFFFAKDYMIINVDDKSWIASPSCILMIHNKICDYLSVLLLCQYSSNTYNPPDSVERTLGLIVELSTLLKKYKSNYYTIARALESICVAETLAEHETWTNKEFLESIDRELDGDIGYRYIGSELQDLMTSSPTSFRHELTCLSKLMGHPYVSIEGGSKSLHSKTTEIYNINLLHVTSCINYIKENYIRNHILRYRGWPPCQLSYGAPAALEQAFVRGKDPNDKSITKTYGKTSINDYVYVELLPNARFNKLENIIPYLKDKTISVLRSKAFKLYVDNTADEDLSVRWEETRLLLAYLLNPAFVHDHVRFIDRYENSDDLSDLLDYLVIKIVPKEKELKVDFRGFGCTTYENRNRLLAQEKNAMEYLDKYSDEQAMTLGELPLLRKLSAFRRLYKAYPGHIILYVVLDASAWNSRHRAETIDRPMSQTLDRIFDTKIFGKTHLAYQKTLYYVANRPVSFSWEGHAGGIEGLNQDTWDIAYIGEIKTALENLGFIVHILVKGDDTRLAIAVPKTMHSHMPMLDIKNMIIDRLHSMMKNFGHVIKIMESYGSSRYFAFSKSASLDDIEYPQGFRKIQKCYGSSNAFISTLDEYIGSSFSNAHSTCRVQPSVVPSYLVALFWSLHYVIHHRCYQGLTDDAYVALMLIPSCAGGFPIIYLHNMSVRAESDLFSPFLGIYSYCKTYHPTVANYMCHFMVIPNRVPTTFKMLFKDPYALPTDRPIQPEALLRRQVRPILIRHAKNRDILELLRMANSGEGTELIRILGTASEFNVKILSCIYSATPDALCDELTRKFEDGRSINELMIRTIGSRRAFTIMRRIIRAEIRLQEWRCSRLVGRRQRNVTSYEHLLTICPAKSAAVVRKFAWGREILGITMPPLQHQLSFCTSLQGQTDSWINNNHFTYNVTRPIKYANIHYQTRHYASGGKEPFIGYATRTGTTEPSVYMIEKDAATQKVKDLLDIVTWTQFTTINEDGNVIVSNAIDLIRTILGLYTSMTMEELSPFCAIRRSGTVQHHVRSPHFKESIVPNRLSNLYTQIVGESNTHIRLRTSRQHYQVNFLHIYCHSVYMIFQELEYASSMSTPITVWAVTVNCHHCNVAIKDRPIIFDNSSLPSISFHPIAYSRIGEHAESIVRDSIASSRLHDIYQHGSVVDNIPIMACYLGILQTLHDSTYFDRLALQTRYHAPSLTSEGQHILNQMAPGSKQRDIGQSEIKRIPVDDLTYYLIHLVNYYSHSLGAGGKLSMSNAEFLMLPGEAMPWYGVMLQIYKVGKLPYLMAEFSRLVDSVSPLCYYNPSTASKYLGRNADKIPNFLKVWEYVVILSNYTSSHVTTQLIKVWTHNISVYIRDHLSKVIKSLSTVHKKKRSVLNLGEDACLDLYYELILLQGLIDSLEEMALEGAEHLLDHKDKEIDSFPLLDVDYEQLLNIAGDTNYEYHPMIAHPLSLLMDYLDWAELPEYCDEDHYYAMFERCNARASRHKVRVIWTTLSACIMAVRASNIEEEEGQDLYQSDMHEGIPRNPQGIIQLKYPRLTVGLTCHDFVPGVARGVVEVDPLSFTRSFLPIHYLYNTSGHNQGSECYFYDALSPVFSILDVSDGEGMNILCCADGYGGAAYMLLSYFHFAKVMFHTISEDLAIESVAVLPLRYGMSQSVVVAPLNEGYQTLHDNQWFNRISEYEYHYEIFTCDLELSDEDINQYQDIMYNLVHFYLQWRHGLAFIAIKISIRHIETNIHLLDLLRHFCNDAALYQPQSMSAGLYAMLIGSGIRTSNIDSFAYITTSCPSHHSYIEYSRFMKTIRNYLNAIRRQTEVDFNILGVDISNRITQKFLLISMQDRYISYILNHLQVTYEIEDTGESKSQMCWMTIKKNFHRYDTPEELSKLIGVNFRSITKELHQALEGRIRSSVAIQHISDTRARRSIIVNKLAIYEGFAYVVSKFQGWDRPWKISSYQCYDNFITWYRGLKKRDRYDPPPSREIFSEPWVHNDVKVFYARSYGTGIRIGFLLATALHRHLLLFPPLIRRHQRHPQGDEDRIEDDDL